MKKQAVLSLSGGMDSSTLLLHLLSNDYEVTALSFDYGQKHKVELERATELVKYLNGCSQKTEQDQLGTITIIGDNFHPIKHQIIKLDGLSSLLNSSLVEGGKDVPEGHYASENMKETVVPNRNKIFSSIIQAVALSVSDRTNEKCYIAMGIHAGDHAIYPDCRQEFRDADMEAFHQGNWGSGQVKIYTPYLETDKFGILQDGVVCCEKLGIEFDEVYKRTNTSYKPIQIWSDEKLEGYSTHSYKEISYKPYYKWHSDYKSAASVERIEAFIKLGRPDSVEYADESGPVSWEVAKQHVKQILINHG
jgi:7-cyano-7-deazaguanine synthase